MTDTEGRLIIIEGKDILVGIVLLQVLFTVLVIFDWLNLGIPVIFRQIVGFIYLTFVLGFLLLCISRIVNHLSLAEIILYSAGMSLSTLMFLGFFINIIYPYIGIKPITEQSLVITLCVFVLLATAYIIYTGKLMNFKLELVLVNNNKDVVASVILFTFLPLISIIGSYLLAYKNTNVIILILYLVISLIPFIIMLKKSIIENFYPIYIWIISISLIFSVVLSLKHLTLYRSDAVIEYAYANIVIKNGIWDNSLYGNFNAMLGITILHPIYSILLNIELENVFKFIYPVIYSLTPVALYLAYKQQTDCKIAFLSTFLFMSIFTFYIVLSRNTRTGLAELFLALIILTLVNTNINYDKKKIIFMLLALSIVTSHYGTSYLFMISIIIYTFLILIIKYIESKRLKGAIHGNKLINPNFVILYIVFCISWYIYNSASSTYVSLISFISHILSSVSNLLSPEESYVSYAFTKAWPFSVRISRDLIALVTLFIIIETIYLVKNIFTNSRNSKMQRDFTILSIIFLGIVIATILPTKIFNPARVYHISLCFLALLAPIGFIRIFRAISIIFKNKNIDISTKEIPLILFSLILSLILLFNSGFISEIITKNDDFAPNVIISKPRAQSIKDPQYIYSLYGELISDQEISAAKWLAEKRDKTIRIYMDVDCQALFIPHIGPPALVNPYIIGVKNKTEVYTGYIFIRAYNIERHISIVERCPPTIKDLTEVYPVENSNKIYTNEGSAIYYKD